MVGCQNLDFVGEITVQRGEVVSTTIPEQEGLIGAEQPEGLWLPERPESYSGYRIERWSGECSGINRARFCPGGVEFYTAADPHNAAFRYTTPQAASTYFVVEPYLYVVWTNSESLFAVGFIQSGIQVLQMDPDFGPILIHSYRVEGGYISARRQFGDHLFLGTFDGIEIIDVSNPAKPTLRSFYQVYDKDKLLNGFYSEILVEGERMYVVARLGCWAANPEDCTRYLLTFDIANLDALNSPCY